MRTFLQATASHVKSKDFIGVIKEFYGAESTGKGKNGKTEPRI
jgi:hypothetical protein